MLPIKGLSGSTSVGRTKTPEVRPPVNIFFRRHQGLVSLAEGELLSTLLCGIQARSRTVVKTCRVTERPLSSAQRPNRTSSLEKRDGFVSDEATDERCTCR